MTPRHLLVVTYYYPPQPGSGSSRWAAMVKHLRRAGHEVTVITAAPPGLRPEVADGVVRTRSLNASPLLRRALLRANPPTPDRPGAGTDRVMPPWLWRGIVPDPWLVTWNPYALAAIRRRMAGIDCVITSSPADSTHLLGLALGSRRPAWIADFRDGWCFEPLRAPFPTAAQRALDRHLERRVASSADRVLAVTAPIADDFRDRLGVDAIHVSNGFDPATETEPVAVLDSRRDLSFVHTGTLLGPQGRDPRPLLAAIRRLIAENPDLEDRVQLVVAGRSEFDEGALLRDAGLGETVRHLGHIPRGQALALQRAATALVLLTSDARGEATGKLYEYLAAGRPIIALARGNEAARIVAETHTGTVVAPDDVQGITRALKAAIDGELDRAYVPRGREPYTYPAPAEKLAAAIEIAIESGGARSRR